MAEGVATTGCTGSAEELEISRLIHGLPVNGISVGAFKDCLYNCAALWEANAPDGVMSLPHKIFKEAPLERVRGSGLTELDVFTAENIDGLIKLANSTRKPEISAIERQRPVFLIGAPVSARRSSWSRSPRS